MGNKKYNEVNFSVNFLILYARTVSKDQGGQVHPEDGRERNSAENA